MAKIPKAIHEYFSALGKKNGSAGGKQAAKNMTKEERQERARKAGKAPRNKSRKISTQGA